MRPGDDDDVAGDLGPPLIKHHRREQTLSANFTINLSSQYARYRPQFGWSLSVVGSRAPNPTVSLLMSSSPKLTINERESFFNSSLTISVSVQSMNSIDSFIG